MMEPNIGKFARVIWLNAWLSTLENLKKRPTNK